MTLHVLIVEDNEAFVEELMSILSSLPGDCEIRVAGSRDQANEMLENGFLDLVILDLKLPTMTGALDADPEHGHAVFNRIRNAAPGTPIFVLTGSPAENFLAGLVLGNHRKIDIWSEGQETGTVQFLKKIDIDQCPGMLSAIAQAVENLTDIELVSNGVGLDLSEDRLIRIFTKKYNGLRCSVSELGGGLSDARVLRLRVTDHRGVQLHDAVAKLSTPQDVRNEEVCYDSHITRLAAAATPRKLTTLYYGAHKLAGIFFGLAEGSNECVFDIAVHSPERSKEVIGKVEAAMAPWIEGVPETRISIGQVRRRLMTDESLEEMRERFNLDWIQKFEDRQVQARWVCCHGDLHGKNIFVSPDRTELIDYGDVGDGPASLDPVTLELSLLFHPAAPERNGAWPSPTQATAWGNLEAYLMDCPYPEFVQECRAWALRAMAGPREVAASAYSYLVRQLKYENTDKDLALALLCGIRFFFERKT